MSSSFAELVDLNFFENVTAFVTDVKLFRGACGSKLKTYIKRKIYFASSSFAELVDLNLF